MTQHKTHLFLIHIAVPDGYVGCWGNPSSLSHSTAQVPFICASTIPKGLVIILQKGENLQECAWEVFMGQAWEAVLTVSTPVSLATTLSHLTTKQYDMSLTLFPGRRDRFWWTPSQCWYKDIASSKTNPYPQGVYSLGKVLINRYTYNQDNLT